MADTWPTPSSPDMWWTQFHHVYGRASTMEAAFQGYLASHGLAPSPSVDELQSAYHDFVTFLEMSAETDASNPVAEPKEAPPSAQLAYRPSLPPALRPPERVAPAEEETPASDAAPVAETTETSASPSEGEGLQEPYGRTVRRPRGE